MPNCCSFSHNTVSKVTRFEISVAMAEKRAFSAQRSPPGRSRQAQIQRICAALSPTVRGVGRYTSSMRVPRCVAPVLQPKQHLHMPPRAHFQHHGPLCHVTGRGSNGFKCFLRQMLMDWTGRYYFGVSRRPVPTVACILTVVLCWCGI